ncbi:MULTISPECIES: carbohydrate kinase family protein [Petrotoga]|uniref:Fructokinase n=6 Tax=Petrotoga TaxID=28236 RepID=A0A4R8ER61_9BACT|nr:MULTISPECIES: carbohydrate kinase [Petrotoga]PNR96438.1 ribokinase [Petrotoga olearia DSM 13574]POZ88541.1 ribokinase [Petrotoga sibirica DSM 13575]RMA76492.1 fructokinase [Petrotoga olearia]TDX14894.1 fructokinase [Petrotoga sibirica]
MAILCAGEILFDFISKSLNKGLGESELFEKRPGGSPFNVAVGVAKLGADVSFLTKISQDEFGKFLFDYLKQNGVNTDCAFTVEGLKTSLAFAAVDAQGKAEYEFYRDNAADTKLELKDIENLDYEKFNVFHFGSIALIDEPTSSTLTRLFDNFVSGDLVTSFDPNIRLSLIKNRENYNSLVKSIIKKVDILKMSDDDLYYLTEKKNVEEAIMTLSVKEGAILFVTLGSQGSLVYKDGIIERVPGYKVKVVETVGCGDSFMAGILYKLKDFSKDELSNITVEELAEYADFANKCAAIVATKQGAANAMPSLSEVSQFEFLKSRFYI